MPPFVGVSLDGVRSLDSAHQNEDQAGESQREDAGLDPGKIAQWSGSRTSCQKKRQDREYRLYRCFHGDDWVDEFRPDTAMPAFLPGIRGWKESGLQRRGWESGRLRKSYRRNVRTA